MPTLVPAHPAVGGQAEGGGGESAGGRDVSLPARALLAGILEMLAHIVTSQR